MGMEALNIVMTAVAGLAGVVLGGWIAGRHERIERQQNRAREQLNSFYSPLLGMRMAIQAKSAVREQVTNTAGAAWAEPFRDVTPGDHETVRTLGERQGYEKVIEENNRQLKEELLPLYRQMIDHFTKNLAHAEPSTRNYYVELVRFVDIWDRWLKGTIPREVLVKLEHTEDGLQPFYQDLQNHHDRLFEHLKK